MAQRLSPIYEHIHWHLITKPYLQCDETMIEYLLPGNGQTKQGYFWVLKAPRGDAVFARKQSRASDVLTYLLPAGFNGALGCDRYAAYRSHAADNAARIRLAFCWAHVRRKYEAVHRRQAISTLKLIIHLYCIERKIRRNKSGLRLRQDVHVRQSALTAPAPASSLHAGKPAPSPPHTAFTLIEACRRQQIVLWCYLRDVLKQMPHMKITQVGQLIVEAWAKAQLTNQKMPPPMRQLSLAA